MKMIVWSACVLLIGSVAACNHEKAATANPSAAAPPPTPSAAAAPSRELTSNRKVSHTLAMSGDIVQLCGIKPTAGASVPKFAFDSADLSDDDHNVLQQLATCMRSGPLRGRLVELIGRADPRGTEEYNLALGSRRARSVNDYLHLLGVDKAWISQTTRGALDATGTNETGWAADRRVDIMLKRA